MLEQSAGCAVTPFSSIEVIRPNKRC